MKKTEGQIKKTAGQKLYNKAPSMPTSHTRWEVDVSSHVSIRVEDRPEVGLATWFLPRDPMSEFRVSFVARRLREVLVVTDVVVEPLQINVFTKNKYFIIF
jgi:hypothetical protein